MSGVYEANPGGLRRCIENMKRLPRMAQTMGEEFWQQENAYTEWPGWTDEFARKVRPQYNDNNTSCVEFSTTLYTALDALVGATLANLENIEGTRADATETIEEHRRRTDTGIFGDGDGDGGGKR